VDTFFGEPIDMGRLEVRVSRDRHRVGPLVIGQDEEHVGARGLVREGELCPSEA
jgi:hypothetical protein